MPKKLTFKTHSAVLIFMDEKKKEPRKIIFGEPTETLALFSFCGAVATNQLKELGAKEFKSVEEMREYIQKMVNGLPNIHARNAYENAHIEFSYQVIEDKK